MIDVSIIIINYNTVALTDQCLESVYKETLEISFEVILVDNASTEKGIEKIAEKYSNLKLIQSKENKGFAGGNNLGISQAKGKYILLLNSDTILKENSILECFNFLELHKNAGIVSPRLIYPNGKIQSVAQRFPSIKYQMIELLRLQKLLSQTARGKLLLGSYFDHKTTTTADWVWGAFFMFRKDILEQLPEKKLDETYFMYWEDVQWCMDIKKLGYTTHLLGTTEVIHIHEGSKGAKSKLMTENEALFFKRNYNSLHTFLIKLLSRLLS